MTVRLVRGAGNAPLAVLPVSAGSMPLPGLVPVAAPPDGVAYAYIVPVVPGTAMGATAGGVAPVAGGVQRPQPTEVRSGYTPKRSRRGNHTESLRLRGCTYWARWQYKGVCHERSTVVRAFDLKCLS